MIDLKSRKEDAKVAFILGTGASVAKIGKHKLEAITSQFSIGVNQWGFHDLIPDAYSYEPDPDPALLEAIQRDDVAQSGSPIFVLAPKPDRQQDHFAGVGDRFRRQMYVYGRVNLVTRSVRNAGPDFVRASDSLRNSLGPVVAPDNGASIVRLLSICYWMGFKKIVLLGVDLNNVRYFWQEEPRFIERFGLASFPSHQTGEVHETMSSDSRPLRISDFIQSLSEAFQQVGVEIEVESSDSLLAEFLPVFNWSEIL